MKVGTICKLKVDCLRNKAGTLGVVFYDYDEGFQAIFENGCYDGFSTTGTVSGNRQGQTEAEFFLDEVGFKASLAGYEFKNVLQVSMDYNRGLFDIAWSKKWKKTAELIEQEIQERLRELSDKTPKDIMVLLPDCTPNDFYRADVEVEFVKVELSRLLHFIADMM